MLGVVACCPPLVYTPLSLSLTPLVVEIAIAAGVCGCAHCDITVASTRWKLVVSVSLEVGRVSECTAIGRKSLSGEARVVFVVVRSVLARSPRRLARTMAGMDELSDEDYMKLINYLEYAPLLRSS